MVRSKKVLTIFLGSPSDLTDERRFAAVATDEWNTIHSDRMGWTVDLLGWEDTLPQTGRPQELINPEIMRCMIFVGMMHRIWGNPTGNGYTSGFHEEFDLATKLHTETGVPEIALFFKDMGSTVDPGDQLKKVIEFRESISTSKKFFYKSLSSDLDQWRSEFRTTFHKLIFAHIDKLEKLEAAESSDSDESSEVPATKNLPVEQGRFRDKMEALQIIAGRLAGAPNDFEVSPADVARLRLLGIAWHRQGMTETHLGTHDANLIFRQGAEFEVTRTEKFALIDSGLAHLKSQNAPLWRWVSEVDGNFEYLEVAALYASDEAVKVGALAAMGSAEIEFESLRDSFESVFDEAKPPVRKAMLDYIGAMGGPDLLDIARKEFQKADYATLAAATSAILRAVKRQSPIDALRFVLEQNVSLPGDDPEVLGAFDAVSEEHLVLGLSHRDAVVRALALTKLNEQGRLSGGQRGELINDPSPVVRKAAVAVAMAAGEGLSLADCQKLIVRQEKNALASVEITRGREEFDALRAQLLRDETDEELVRLASDVYSPAEFAYSALLARHWKDRAAEARANVKDRFKSFYMRLRESWIKTYGEAVTDKLFPTKTDLVFEFRASQMVRETMDVIAIKGSKEDLPLFRSAVTGKYMTLSKADLSFFAKFGSPDDIELIARLDRTSGGSLMQPNVVVPIQEVARTILKIARSDLNLVMSKSIPDEVKKAVVAVCAKSAIVAVKNSVLIGWLNSKHDELRRDTAVRVTQSLTKKRVKEISDIYLAQEFYYYNVSHWLDLALSMPGSVVGSVCAAHRQSTT